MHIISQLPFRYEGLKKIVFVPILILSMFSSLVCNFFQICLTLKSVFLLVSAVSVVVHTLREDPPMRPLSPEEQCNIWTAFCRVELAASRKMKWNLQDLVWPCFETCTVASQYAWNVDAVRESKFGSPKGQVAGFRTLNFGSLICLPLLFHNDLRKPILVGLHDHFPYLHHYGSLWITGGGLSPFKYRARRWRSQLTWRILQWHGSRSRTQFENSFQARKYHGSLFFPLCQVLKNTEKAVIFLVSLWKIWG